MEAFLDLCAEHLSEAYTHQSESLCVVLPTRRSGLILEQLLKTKSPSFNAHITHIEDFITQASGYEKQSPVMLLLELYEIFSKIDPNIRLERFTGWGHILIRDFDQIDRNLVDAQQLFKTLSDVKSIERWRLGEDKITPRIGEYFQLWEHLHETYLEFKQSLDFQKKSYPGLMYRHLAENASELLLRHPIYQKYFFIGFNALSKAEENIFKCLLEHQKAEIIWDTDEYYMRENTENKAGFFLKKYNKSWDRTNWHFRSNYLLTSPKDIHVIQVANASMQGKVVNQLLKNWTVLPQTEETDLIIPPTAVVLADENLLLSVLSSLDNQFEGMNITLGLALKQSALFNLIDILFELFQTLITDKETREPKFNHRGVIKFLNHPFIRQYEKKWNQTREESEKPHEGKSFILAMINFINRNNRIYMSQEELLSIVEHELFQERCEEDVEQLEFYRKINRAMTPLIEAVFVKWRNTFQLILSLESLSTLLYSEDNFLEAAYFREFQKILAQLKGFVLKKPKFIDIRTFKLFLYQAFRETKFDFDSDKDSSIQLMGIAESRNLDYENVAILSVNETILPRSKKINSFIPLDVSESFGLPSYQEQDAVVSYHFYRLLQRAKNIALIYVAPSDTYGGKEKSRFIHQLENDLRRLNPLVNIRESVVRFKSGEEKPESELIIHKNDEIIENIKQNLKKGLTPSQINSFINCSMQYFFGQINGYSSVNSVEEVLGADKLGTLTHEILEEIFRELTQHKKLVDKTDIEAILPKVPDLVQEKFNKDIYSSYVFTGRNYIFKQITAKYIQQFLISQMEEIERQGAPFEILSLENVDNPEEDKPQINPTVSASLKLTVHNEDIYLSIRGITDRVDKVKDEIRIIDYKTGKVESAQLKLNAGELDALVNEPKKDKARQLWLYKYIFAKHIIERGGFRLGEFTIQENQALTAGIYSLRNLNEGLLVLKSDDKKSLLFPENLNDYIQVSEKYLHQIISKMLDRNIPFERTDDLAMCQRCTYKEMCGRS